MPTILICVELVLVRDLWAIFADRDLDSLVGKALAEWRRLDHTRKLLGRVDSEGLREAGCEYGTFAIRNNGIGTLSGAHVTHA